MTTPPPQEDLFGNPIDVAPRESDAPHAAAARDVVNDMDLTHTVLAEINDGATPLHRDATGQVRWCENWTSEPVPDRMAVVVEQLLAARYLTTRRDPCTGHGPVVVTTQAGRNAVHRWAAYRRPSSWGPPPGITGHRRRGDRGGLTAPPYTGAVPPQPQHQ